MNPRCGKSPSALEASSARARSGAHGPSAGPLPRVALVLLAAFVVSCFAFSPAFASSWSKPTRSGSPSSGPTPPVASPVVAGNYCVSCHDTADPRLAQASDWRGSPSVTPSACPGLQSEDEQLYYAGQVLQAIHRVDAGSPGLPTLYAEYDKLLDAPRLSADAYAAQAQLLAYKAGKVYTAATQAVTDRRRLFVLLAAALVTAFLLFAFGWGLRHTLRFQPVSNPLRTWRPGARSFGVLAVVVVLFALPLFRAPASVVATASADDQAAQAELDKSTRAGDVAERSLARAWMLGRIAAAWSQLDPARGEQLLSEALAAESAARAEADSLWGRSQASREAAVGSPAAQDKAALVSEQLLSVRSRAWALRLIAVEWWPVDKVRAHAILTAAEDVARSNPTIYGEIDRAAVAAAWSRLDPTHPFSATVSLQPSIPAADSAIAKALALYRSGEYARAWDAAVAIADEWERARAQAAIAAAWGSSDAASKVTLDPLRQWATRTISGTPSTPALPPDPAEALAVIDRLPSEADKAEALRALALSTRSPDIFDRALKMAAAVRVRGDPLAPSRASLALATALSEQGGSPDQVRAALAQAYDLTAKIGVKYK